MAYKIRAKMTKDENFVRVFFNVGNLQGRYDIDISAHRSAGRSATDLKKMELIYAAISDVGQDLAAKKAAIRKRL
jgi:hypothetical protein